MRWELSRWRGSRRRRCRAASGRAKKLPYQVGQEVWVRARVTRVATKDDQPDYTQVTVELPTKNKDTIWLRENDERDPLKPVD